MLQAAAQANKQTLRTAAARLDQTLIAIGRGRMSLKL
jgi:hypothetical protein